MRSGCSLWRVSLGVVTATTLLLTAACSQLLGDNASGPPPTTPDGTVILPLGGARPATTTSPGTQSTADEQPLAEDRRSEPSSDTPYDPYVGMVIEEAGCTPPPGGEPSGLIPPVVPPEGEWCYVVQTVDGRYAYAAAITQAQQHHEDLYFGGTPIDVMPPPMLHLSCTYIPLMSWGWMDDDPNDPDTHSYYIEYYFMPRVTYDKYLNEGLWGLVDMVGWQLDVTSSGENFRIDWSQERWNPPHENTPVWVSPADTAGHLVGSMNQYFSTGARTLNKVVYRGMAEPFSPSDAYLFLTFQLGLHRIDAYNAAPLSMRERFDESFADGKVPVYAESSFRIGATGFPETDAWRTIFGDACARLGTGYDQGS